jgi:hypothetical protein
MTRQLFLTTILIVAATAVAADLTPAPAKSEIATKYGATAQKIIAAAMRDNDGLRRLEYLCDRIGNRVTGSESLEKAVRWAAEEMRKAGLENVRTPPVTVPHWVRGSESATLLEPFQKRLWMMSYGLSVGTPRGGITGEVISTLSPEQLSNLGRAKVEGKIVLFAVERDRYSEAVNHGPARAAAMGAKAVLIRSGFPMQGPHTSQLIYEEGASKIPTASISVEDADLIERLTTKGMPVRLRLEMEAHFDADVEAHNVVGDFLGSEKPKEIVVLGGHIDSWDVGQGAHDDGTGIMASLEAVLLIKQLGLRPKRTLRVVFFTNEESGHRGGQAYRTFIGDEVKNHVAGIEDDHGAEKPIGFGFGGAQHQALFPGAYQRALEIGELLSSINAGKISGRGSGGDIRPITEYGAPGFAMRTINKEYDFWHHTEGDTFDKVVPNDFRLHVASLAVLAFVLADMPERMSELN